MYISPVLFLCFLRQFLCIWPESWCTLVCFRQYQNIYPFTLAFVSLCFSIFRNELNLHLIRGRECLDANSQFGRSVCAALTGHADCMRLLLEAGADKEAKDNVRVGFSTVNLS